jgi:uncharacterized domain HDIG
MEREKAFELLKKYNKERFHIQHSITVEEVMKWFAKELGYDADYWGIIGLLHDIDYEMYPEEHCIKAVEILESENFDKDIIRSICSHGYNIVVDIKPEHEMEKVLYAVDEIDRPDWCLCKSTPVKKRFRYGVEKRKEKLQNQSFCGRMLSRNNYIWSRIVRLGFG